MKNAKIITIVILTLVFIFIGYVTVNTIQETNAPIEYVCMDGTVTTDIDQLNYNNKHTIDIAYLTVKLSRTNGSITEQEYQLIKLDIKYAVKKYNSMFSLNHGTEIKLIP